MHTQLLSEICEIYGHFFTLLLSEIYEGHSDFGDFSGRKNRKGIFGQKLSLNTPNVQDSIDVGRFLRYTVPSLRLPRAWMGSGFHPRVTFCPKIPL